MYGTYAYNAGATAAQVVADVLALVTGADPATLSNSCNKALTTAAGAASGWQVEDANYGVLSAPCIGGGPASRKLARVTAATKLQLSTVDSWNNATHVAGTSTSALDVSLAFSAAGAVNFLATDEVLMLAASDWSVWQCVCEIKRDGPLLSDAGAPSWVILGTTNYCYAPRFKNLTAAGDSTNVSLSVASAYGTLTGSTTRDRAERLYIPMAPAVASLSSVPVGEFVGVMVSGGYGQSGDYMLDASGDVWQLSKGGAVIYAIKRK